MRFTIPDLMADQQRIEQYLERQFSEIDALIAEIEQPADSFDGQGDFEYRAPAFELLLGRAAQLSAQAAAADVVLKNVEAILDRPLTRLPKKDLIMLIRAAQDALAQPVEVIG